MNPISNFGPGCAGLPLALRLARGGSLEPGIGGDPAKTGARNTVHAAIRRPKCRKA